MELTVWQHGHRPHHGLMRDGRQVIACALGRNGVTCEGREGDGATPAGLYPLRRVLYRADRMARPKGGLPAAPIGLRDGWCDAPGDPAYNRPVRLPYAASAEALRRRDGLYDLVVVIGHNDAPPVAGLGSAIFLHVARPGLGPTLGCIALPAATLRRLVAGLGPASRIRILPPRHAP